MKIVETLRDNILSSSFVYNSFQALIGGEKGKTLFVKDHVRPQAGEKVLDIGCGPGVLLNYLPAVDYYGIDGSAEYIRNAQQHFGNHGHFTHVDIDSYQPPENYFDIAVAHGVLHHLTDDQARLLFKQAKHALKPDGRLITLDGCYHDPQPWADRWMLQNDRGKFVRYEAEYSALARTEFSRVKTFLRQDLLRLPYSHLIMECVNG